MEIKGFLGNESTFNEYKEFFLDINTVMHLPDESIDNYLNGILDDDYVKIILINIGIYIEKYFSLYFTSFRNTQRPLTNRNNYGILNIGVIDTGYISGIPIFNYGKYKQSIYDFVEIKIKEQFLKKKISCLNDMHHEPSCVNVDFKIVELEKSSASIPPESDTIAIKTKEFHDRYHRTEKARILLHEYEKQMHIWEHLVKLYGCKLTNILDNPHVCNDYINYIKTYYPILIKKTKDAHDDVEITYLSNKIILTNRDYADTLLDFRDVTRDELKKHKPQKAVDIAMNKRLPFSGHKPKLHSLVHISQHIDTYKRKDDITYILIQIEIPLQCDTEYIYSCYDNDKNRTIIKKRKYVSDDLEPCNIDLFIK